jgi:hypothetical protein
MKALTLWQPMATLVAIGAKKIETRSWATRHRGRLAIHSAKKFTYQMRYLAYWSLPFREALNNAGRLAIAPIEDENLPLGCVVAVCDLVDCVPITTRFATSLSDQEQAFGDYSPGRYAWVLENVREIRPPVAACGHQGLWGWDAPRQY